MSSRERKGGPKVPPKAPDADQPPGPDDTDVARQEALAGEIMDEDRKVLRRLAE